MSPCISKNPRLVVFSYSQLGHDCLKVLIEGKENIAAVFTHADSPQELIWFDSVATLARNHGIPVLTPSSLRDPSLIDFIKTIRPDLIFSFYYRNLIGEDILSIAPLGAFNMHGSLLPAYRGKCPVNWAIIHGESETGATLHHMVKAADAGDIVDQQAVPILLTDTAGIVMQRINEAAQTLLKRQLPFLKSGTANRFPQDLSSARYFGGRSSKDSRIFWQKTAMEIHNLVRALQPFYPAAFTNRREEIIEIMGSKPPLQQNSLAITPGPIVSLRDQWIEVACGEMGNERLKVNPKTLSQKISKDFSKGKKVIFSS